MTDRDRNRHTESQRQTDRQTEYIFTFHPTTERHTDLRTERGRERGGVFV